MDQWIVTNYPFVKHYTLAAAEGERDRLTAAHPERSFRIHRIKGTLAPSNSTSIIADLEADKARLEARAAELKEALNDLVAASSDGTFESDWLGRSISHARQVLKMNQERNNG